MIEKCNGNISDVETSAALNSYWVLLISSSV